MAKKGKYYVVWEGVNPGIYTSWDAAKVQIQGYPNAKYKAFSTKAEAEEAFQSPYSDFIRRKARPEKMKTDGGAGPVVPSISVDAACSGNPGKMEYQGVNTENKDLLFYQGPFEKGTNNIGEFLAIVHALALLKKQKDEKTPVYTDSRTALSWIRRKKANTKLAKGKSNAFLFELIERAETWLKNNSFKNPLLKWETRRWGESPADFGRK